MAIEISPIKIEHEFSARDSIVEKILTLFDFKDGDILVVAQKIISKIEQRTVSLDSVVPSLVAEGLASAYNKDPRIVELILLESKKIIRLSAGIIITETNHGFICANAGIDESNVPLGFATLLPLDPGKSAKTIREEILKKTGKKIAVIISDTFGRPFRVGQTNISLGSAGIGPLLDYSGTKDVFDRKLRVTEIAICDELCGAAELVMAKTNKAPCAVIRNYSYSVQESRSIIREKHLDLFR